MFLFFFVHQNLYLSTSAQSRRPSNTEMTTTELKDSSIPCEGRNCKSAACKNVYFEAESRSGRFCEGNFTALFYFLEHYKCILKLKAAFDEFMEKWMTVSPAEAIDWANSIVDSVFLFTEGYIIFQRNYLVLRHHRSFCFKMYMRKKRRSIHY